MNVVHPSADFAGIRPGGMRFTLRTLLATVALIAVALGAMTWYAFDLPLVLLAVGLVFASSRGSAKRGMVIGAGLAAIVVVPIGIWHLASGLFVVAALGGAFWIVLGGLFGASVGAWKNRYDGTATIGLLMALVAAGTTGIVLLFATPATYGAMFLGTSRGMDLTRDEANGDQLSLHAVFGPMVKVPAGASHVNYHYYSDKIAVLEFALGEQEFLDWARREGWQPKEIDEDVSITRVEDCGRVLWDPRYTGTTLVRKGLIGYGRFRFYGQFTVVYDRENRRVRYEGRRGVHLGHLVED